MHLRPSIIWAFLAGTLLVPAFAPYGLWPLAILSPAFLLHLWHQAPHARHSFALGLSYGLGLFGCGVSWVFVSIHDYGHSNKPTAILITTLFVSVLALFIACQGYVLKRYFKGPVISHALLGFPSTWVLFEWLRSVLFSGFPWLYLGYAGLDTPLQGYAPLASVYAVSTSMAFSSGLCYLLYTRAAMKIRLHCLFLGCLAWGLGAWLHTQIWVHDISAHPRYPTQTLRQPQSTHQDPLASQDHRPHRYTVSLVQGNIKPLDKFVQADPIASTERIYGTLSQAHWGADLILWPEGAIPLSVSATGLDTVSHRPTTAIPAEVPESSLNGSCPLRHPVFAQQKSGTPPTGSPVSQLLNPPSGMAEASTCNEATSGEANAYLKILDQRAAAHHATLIAGIQSINAQGEYYNSLIALGQGHGIYHKVHLVPFGDFLPFDAWLRGLTDFFNLPMSSFSAGPEQQPLLEAHTLHNPLNTLLINPLICYEIAFPEQVRRTLRNAAVIVTLSEDGWFGNSLGPPQHLQIARMRALETGRYVLRVTTSGLTAIINAQGQVISSIPPFKAGVLSGHFEALAGQTPWVRWGLWPLLTILLLGFLGPGRLKSRS